MTPVRDLNENNVIVGEYSCLIRQVLYMQYG